MRQHTTETFHTGATIPVVHDLLLHTNNNSYLSAYRESIFKIYGDSHRHTRLLMFSELLKKTQRSYVETHGYNQPKTSGIWLTEDGEKEYCEICEKGFQEWKEKRSVASANT